MPSPFASEQARSNDEVKTGRTFVSSFSGLLNHNIGGSRNRVPADEGTSALSVKEPTLRVKKGGLQPLGGSRR